MQRVLRVHALLAVAVHNEALGRKSPALVRREVSVWKLAMIGDDICLVVGCHCTPHIDAEAGTLVLEENALGVVFVESFHALGLLLGEANEP
eukprot:CAMPEP_0180650422 /NCGR_PEP_ID=MMETSP1037_2-20121125/52222_1 /TAXON_ID=632150 /ORGANISM="Azadinium spinosum, Strain 3D9" /LENGTH=91 /DNA_ID=CAMNT_0022675761 /DNA_START=632 /DNA_END=903 /DNA_ORIENTATION=-